MRGIATAIAIILVSAMFGDADGLLLYVPFDESADAVFAGGEAGNLHPEQDYEAGMAGHAVVLQKDCEFLTAGNFNPRAGTISAWVRPHWGGDAAEPHYLLCMYGADELVNSWAVNRWSVNFSGGRCRFTIYTDTEGKSFSVEADIRRWRAAEWHNVTATWSGVNSGRANARMQLYIDGEHVAGREGLRISVGPVSDVMAIGRDQDASPDYADAEIDELFVYGRVLSDAEIREGYDWAGEGRHYIEGSEPRRRGEIANWWDEGWPYRARVTVPQQGNGGVPDYAECSLRMSAHLAQLGVPGRVIDESIRVINADGQVLPSRIDGGLVQWPLASVGERTPADFDLYGRAAVYEIIGPLKVAVARHDVQPGPQAGPPRDYATVAYGRPWDFDDGTFAGIDQWGDKLEYIRNKQVEDGILSMDVETDPFFIWGNMWGQIEETTEDVAIDLQRFPILEMRIRQSVPSAMWQLFGRPKGQDSLLRHEFTVTGTGWQRVRIDLIRDARWAGVLSAFRIDPTDGVGAHVEIDWVRLVSAMYVAHGPVETIGFAEGAASAVEMSIADTTVRAGATEELTVTVRGDDGAGIKGQPVRVELLEGSGGRFEAVSQAPSLTLGEQARRALTDENGTCAFRYVASERAKRSADRIVAIAEFSGAARAQLEVDTVPGPPDHYLVAPVRTAALQQDSLPIEISAQLVDEYGNAVAEKRTLTWETDEAGQMSEATLELDENGRATAMWRGDESKRWVYYVWVEDEEGMTGRSAAICLLPSGARRAPIVLGDNGYFRRGADGPVWIPLGGFYANWVGLPEGGEEGRRLISFVEATEQQLAHWLEFLASQGVTAMRFMLRAHTPRGMEPMDVIGRVNMPLFAKVLRYMDLARKHGIKFMLTIHEDYTKPAYYNRDALETFCIPRYDGEDLDKLPAYQRRFVRDRRLIDAIPEKYTDPDVIACQDQYMRQLIGLLRDNPQLFAWELENEMVNCPADWANHAIGVIREMDPVTPICASHGGGGLKTADPLWWVGNTDVDFYTYHLYPTRATTSADIDYGAAVDILTRYGRMAGTCMLGESSGDEFGRYPRDDADREYIMRDIIWFSIINGNPGCFFWNARGREVRQFKLANEIVSGMDWKNWRRAQPEIGIIVDHPMEDDKYYRTEQGEKDYAMMGRYVNHYLSAGVDFDFTMTADGYEQTADLEEFAPPAGQAPISAGEPWHIGFNARRGMGEGLAYIRNVAGICHWEEENRRRAANMYVREREPAPLKVRFNLPHEEILVTATDLDNGDTKRERMRGTGELDLGRTEHDWAIVWRAR